MFETFTCFKVTLDYTCASKHVVTISNVDVFQLAGSVSFLSLAMLNPSGNSNRKKSCTCYKTIIQFWRHSIAIKVRATLIKTCANLRIFVCFCWRRFECCFATFVTALVYGSVNKHAYRKGEKHTLVLDKKWFLMIPVDYKLIHRDTYMYIDGHAKHNIHTHTHTHKCIHINAD